MSRNPRYPEPTPDEAAGVHRIFSTLEKYISGCEPVTREVLEKELVPWWKLFEQGVQETNSPPVSYFPWFLPHIDAALKRDDGALLALLTAALILIRQFEHHMPEYLAKIRSKQATGRSSAAKRKDEGNNVGTWVDAWERGKDRPMTPRSRADIDACAAASKDGYSEVTIRDYLYKRAREARKNST